MTRNDFIKSTAGAAVATAAGIGRMGAAPEDLVRSLRPYAITMWEFSWLERRWPGAGYEDWDEALGELTARGYNAVRIDAFPHLIWNDPDQEYLLEPWWDTQDWGSPAINRVQVQPALNNFIRACARHRVKVGLSSWFRRDENDLQMRIETAEDLGAAWLSVLDSIKSEGLLDHVFYVDLCNEWTGPAWCPFFENDPPEAVWTGWHTEKSKQWMRDSIALLQDRYPDLPYTFSFTGGVTENTLENGDFPMLDFLEPHIWMTSSYGGEFYEEVGYSYDRFEGTSYRNLALKGEEIYRARADYWQQGLKEQIKWAAKWSRQAQQALITTECWGVVDFKDAPLLDWDWVKELCALGTKEAAKTGRWLAIATSNFCGPQFVGMWRDIEWHKELTDIIRNANIDTDVADSKLARRMVEQS